MSTKIFKKKEVSELSEIYTIKDEGRKGNFSKIWTHSILLIIFYVK